MAKYILNKKNSIKKGSDMNCFFFFIIIYQKILGKKIVLRKHLIFCIFIQDNFIFQTIFIIVHFQNIHLPIFFFPNSIDKERISYKTFGLLINRFQIVL